MLNRQKCILCMLERAERPVSGLELTKWAFLLAQEMPSRGGSAFYDFLPYQYGPFSFVLYREMDRLLRDGYVAETRTSNGVAWERSGDVSEDVSTLPRGIFTDANRIVDRFAQGTSKDLIDYVYGRFPWYTANSRIRRLAQRPVAQAAVYTIGYEGCTIDRLLNVLMRGGIRRIIDVRRNPVARRYGFHKSSMSRLCGKIDIDYVHVPEVGIPSELRRDLSGPRALARLFETYEKELLPRGSDAVAGIARLMVDSPSALLCMEADPAMCHRSRVADAVSTLTHLPVHHLQGKKCDPAMN